MVAFLIKRPIAVTMAFLGVLVLGLVAASFLPVSLVPDVDIPRITVNVTAPNYAARQLENSVMSPLRSNLMQVNRLKDIKTESRDGSGMVSLEFDYGTNIDLAYIEINEQVDRAIPSLPSDVPRPAVIKASASDIPVFYLDITRKDTGLQSGSGSQSISDIDFLELSEFADEIIRRRLEQIPQVAMADMSGRTFPEIIITPDMDKLRAMNLSPAAIEEVIRANNISFGNIFLRDKQYQYSVRVGDRLLDAGDIGDLYLNHRGRLWQLKDLCTIETRPQYPEGAVYAGGQRAISLAVIKQADARMQDLKHALHEMIVLFETDYPFLNFTITRDQTTLLDYTMGNLRQTLMIGAGLAFLVMFIFLRDPRAPWLVIISVPAAIVVSMLFFFLIGISLNVVSISGLVLCIGMMIDNAIIVIDNISRHRKSGKSLSQACVDGTNEVFRPLLSSVLTTCSVFIPLIFLGGLAGALFFDQAMAVTIGLSVSLLIAMTLVPVYYYALYKKSTPKGSNFLARINPLNYASLYGAGFRFAMRRQGLVWIMAGGLVAVMAVMMLLIEKERLPVLQREAALLWIDWNENIHLEENSRRIHNLMEELGPEVMYSTIQAGRQQFMLDKVYNNSAQQSLIYILTSSASQLERVMDKTAQVIGSRHPSAIFHFREEGNLFDQLFADSQAPLEIRLRPMEPYGRDLPGLLQTTIRSLEKRLPGTSFDALPMQQSVALQADLQLMALHEVNMTILQQTLTRLFNEHMVFTLMDSRSSIPVKIGGNPSAIEDLLHAERVTSRNGVEVPLHMLLRKQPGQELQTIIAGIEGEYYPLQMDVSPRDMERTKGIVRESLREEGLFEASFAGSIFARRQLTRDLLMIGVVALLLLFFILAAQFESLKLPVIVLLEVPLAMTGALLMLIIFGVSLNIMAMIGMVVMTGIIINDSILKIDTINRLRDNGMPLIRALHTAGKYRLKPILMTSITTICALVPFLFIGGLGGDLQKPLALAVIGGLGLGTLVSLYFIPVCYYYLYRKKQ